MNLLPRTEVDFAQVDYWNKFFRERGSKKFEWYGEYEDLIEMLQRYLKTQDIMLMVGCGNSMLSFDLYDFGYRNITNIDISPVVIKQMKEKLGSKASQMVFEQMDAMNMSYKPETFTVVLDKGTLDALMPDDTESDRNRVTKFFSEIDRVLKLNGRYIIISLLQEHILQAILKHFTELGWMIRVLRCWNVEKRHIAEKGCLTMPVFMIVCVKFRNLNNIQPIIEVNLFIDGKSERIKSKEEAVAIIKAIQGITMHCRQAKEEVEIKFCSDADDSQRYTIFLVDASQDQRRLLTYAAFLVPHGRETDWLFGTIDGRKYLRQSSGYDRLAVIIFHRGQKYGTLQDVQDELRQSVLQLAPPFMPIISGSPNIPYLTLGDGVGHRVTIYSGKSEFSGDFVVEDVEIETEKFRRLVFMNNQAMVQSEFKLRKVADEGNKTETHVVDSSHIASQHILYMSIPAVTKSVVCPKESQLKVAVVGVGGGSLCVLLKDLLGENASITGVEIDPAVVDVAEKFFGLKTDERLKVIVKNGVDFLKERNKFDVIILDVDSKERGAAVSGPPPQFLESSTLEAVVDSLGEGVFVTNVVSRVKSEHAKLIKNLKRHFALVSWYDLKEDLNRVVFASNIRGKSKTQWQQEIKDGAQLLERILQEKLTTAHMELHHLFQHLMV